MFLPSTASTAKSEKEKKRQITDKIEGWAMALVPDDIRKSAQITVQEVQCGDPSCAPIDTLFTIMFESGGRGMAALPLEPREVKKEDLDQAFPTPEVLQAWYRGEEAEWPPDQDIDDDDDLEMPPLRFAVGQKVFCRIGATQWAPGSIEQLWYREQGWPEGSWAPYKVLLDDGRNIFAPADVNQVIKAADDAT